MSALPIPKRIHRGEREVTIWWDDHHVGHYPARDLRLACRCAACIEEMTGRPLLDPASVPEEVAPRSITLVGSYAIQISWSDGHHTGIYAYDALKAMCPCDQCRGASHADGG